MEDEGEKQKPAPLIVWDWSWKKFVVYAVFVGAILLARARNGW